MMKESADWFHYASYNPNISRKDDVPKDTSNNIRT